MIFVDDREDGRRIKQLIGLNLPIELTRLEFGDYCWVDPYEMTWAVEHKTVTDLLNSVSSGRLHDQMRGVCASYFFPILVINGSYAPTRDGFISANGQTFRMRYDALRALLVSLAVRGVMVEQVTSDFAFASALRAWYNLAERGIDNGGYHRPKTPVLAFREESAAPIRVLAQIGGIGEEKAVALLQHFGSLTSVLAAGEKQLRAVRGVGPKLAKAIRAVMEEPYVDAAAGR